MDGFKEGYQFFVDHASDFSGIAMGDAYVDGINEEINEFGYREHDPVLIMPDFMRKTCER